MKKYNKYQTAYYKFNREDIQVIINALNYQARAIRASNSKTMLSKHKLGLIEQTVARVKNNECDVI